MRRMLAVLAFTIGCKASGASAQEGGDIAVPKMPPDAATNTSGSSTSGASADPVAIVKTSGSDHGWHLEDGQSSPKYVEASALATELRDAARSGNLALAVIDERIEECSSAGGTHVLLKTDLGLVHFGGHGATFGPDPTKGEHAVVAFEKLAAPESIEKKTFCVPARTIVARARVVLVVARASDGERLIADLAK